MFWMEPARPNASAFVLQQFAAPLVPLIWCLATSFLLPPEYVWTAPARIAAFLGTAFWMISTWSAGLVLSYLLFAGDDVHAPQAQVASGVMKPKPDNPWANPWGISAPYIPWRHHAPSFAIATIAWFVVLVKDFGVIVSLIIAAFLGALACFPLILYSLPRKKHTDNDE